MLCIDILNKGTRLRALYRWRWSHESAKAFISSISKCEDVIKHMTFAWWRRRHRAETAHSALRRRRKKATSEKETQKSTRALKLEKSEGLPLAALYILPLGSARKPSGFIKRGERETLNSVSFLAYKFSFSLFASLIRFLLRSIGKTKPISCERPADAELAIIILYDATWRSSTRFLVLTIACRRWFFFFTNANRVRGGTSFWPLRGV